MKLIAEPPNLSHQAQLRAAEFETKRAWKN
jgi:hypothetical protein